MEDLFALVRKCVAEYRTLADAYDGELLKSYNSGHGTPEMVEHLRRANGMAEDTRTALQLYHDAVAELAACLNNRKD